MRRTPTGLKLRIKRNKKGQNQRFALAHSTLRAFSYTLKKKTGTDNRCLVIHLPSVPILLFAVFYDVVISQNHIKNHSDYYFTVMASIPVRTLECCSGDLADLKVKSIDVEAWSPRQKKYFEVGSCSNLGDAQARRLKIRVKGEDGNKYFAHTLNNTVVAPPRMLIAFLENNLQEDGSVRIPEALRPYMGGMEAITVK
jgi:hypothetical protein